MYSEKWIIIIINFFFIWIAKIRLQEYVQPSLFYLDSEEKSYIIFFVIGNVLFVMLRQKGRTKISYETLYVQDVSTSFYISSPPSLHNILNLLHFLWNLYILLSTYIYHDEIIMRTPPPCLIFIHCLENKHISYQLLRFWYTNVKLNSKFISVHTQFLNPLNFTFFSSILKIYIFFQKHAWFTSSSRTLPWKPTETPTLWFL